MELEKHSVFLRFLDFEIRLRLKDGHLIAPFIMS